VVLALLIVTASWLGTGNIATRSNITPALKPIVIDSTLARVQVRQLSATIINDEVKIHGRTAPNQQTQLRAEIASKVLRIEKDKGSLVKKGDLLVQLNALDIPSRLRHAKSLTTQRRLEHQAANKLKRQNLLSKSSLAEATALLESAKANVDTLSLQLEHTYIRAPFDGIFSNRFVDVGHYVKTGDNIGTVSDFNPLKITGVVPEKSRHKLHVGQLAEIRLLNGKQLTGKVHHISSIGNINTHTFNVEVVVDINHNSEKENQITGTSGITAQVTIKGREIMAYLISPALFELNAEGNLGIKIVNSEDIIAFVPIEVVKANETGTWITGDWILNFVNTIDLVVVGQGYVVPGQRVEKVYIDEQQYSFNGKTGP